MGYRIRNRAALFVLAVGVSLSQAYAATDTVLLLYTADLHDHLRSGPGGIGGTAYVSGYVKQQRSRRRDTLLVDAGDVLNKGDWVAYATKGDVMYQAMRQAGYTAGAPGNHDFVYGLPQLLKNAASAGFPLLCANAVKNDGTPLALPRSLLVDADGVKVGIIGFTLPGARFGGSGCRSLDVKQTAAVLAAEAVELDKEAHLIVAVGHFPSDKCRNMAEMVPQIDVFVAGHSHQPLAQPLNAETTGGLVVQAGSNAGYVGSLELTVDLDSEEIVDHKARLVQLDHTTIPCDAEMAQWIDATERATCPEAREVLGKAGESIGNQGTGTLYARALREMADVDVAFANPRRLLAGFSAGQTIDRNAVFATHRMDGRRAVLAQLSGADLRGFLEQTKSARLCPCWDGFSARIDFTKPPGQRVVETDLAAERTYSVVMHDDLPRRLGGKLPPESLETCSFTATEALEAHIRALTAKGEAVRHP